MSSAAADDPHCADSFETLYLEHAPDVHRFCLSQVGSRSVAEDLTHETFLRAFAVDERLRPQAAALRPWLLRIARNLSIDHHRRGGRGRSMVDRLRSTGAPALTVETAAEQRDQLQRIHTELLRMRPRERELIGLRVAADLSYRDIAAVLGINEATAKVATNRALTRLRARLEDAP